MMQQINSQQEVEIIVFLGQRYGDGLVYLSGSKDRLLFERAVDLGLVSDEGYLTPAGYRFWRSRQN